MPTWLTILSAVVGTLVGILTVIKIFDAVFTTRRGALTTGTLQHLQEHQWTLADRIALEKRLATIEATLAQVSDVHDTLEVLLARILHSPHRAELDRLLEKIEHRERLTDSELMFAKDWLSEIAKDEEAAPGEKIGAAMLLALVGKRPWGPSTRELNRLEQL